MPGFLAPPDPIHDPTDPETTTVTTTTRSSTTGLDDDDGGPAGHDPLRSAPGNLGPSQVSTADPAALESLIGVAFNALGLLLHSRLTPGDDNAVWIPDEQDVAEVAGPLSRIVARRVKVADRVAGDLTDLVDAGVAAAGYTVRNIGEAHELRAARAAVDEATPE